MAFPAFKLISKLVPGQLILILPLPPLVINLVILHLSSIILSPFATQISSPFICNKADSTGGPILSNLILIPAEQYNPPKKRSEEICPSLKTIVSSL